MLRWSPMRHTRRSIKRRSCRCPQTKESKQLQELKKKALKSISSSTMQTVITGITAMEAKGYNLKAEDWRKHRQEVLRATPSLADDQAIAQRNQSIPDVQIHSQNSGCL